MIRRKTYTCVKCGKPFTKAIGGVIMTPKEMELEMHPVCDSCKLANVIDFFMK